jgi:DNA-binding CsgD family transcriptional regulator
VFNLNNLSQAVFNHTIPWIYLLDYTSGKYLMVSNSIKFMLGYDPDYFKEGGIGATLENYDVNHMRLFNEEIFPDRLQLLKSIPVNEHPDYVFSYNFSFKNRNGEPVNLLQRNCFVKSDEKGNPLLSFGTITDVNHYKSDNPVIQVVEKINSAESFAGTSVVLKKAYYFNGEDRLFTKRERELLLWLTDGLNSRQIASKLFISEYTVINHKRNMMRKCSANNVSELVSFSIRQGII